MEVLVTKVDQLAYKGDRIWKPLTSEEAGSRLLKLIATHDSQANNDRAGDHFDAQRADLAEFIQLLTPAVANKLRPELDSAEWNISAIRVLADAKSADPATKDPSFDKLEQSIDNLSDALNDMPPGGSVKLRDRINGALATTKQTLRNTAVERTMVHLGIKSPSEVPNLIAIVRGGSINESELERIILILGEIANEAPDDKEIPKLSDHLSYLLLALRLEREIATIEKSLQETKKITDVPLRQLGLTVLHDQVGRNRLAAMGSPHPALAYWHDRLQQLHKAVEKDLIVAIEEIGRKEAATQAQRLRAYQEWALKQVEEYGRHKHEKASMDVDDFEQMCGPDRQGVLRWPTLEKYPELGQFLEKYIPGDKLPPKNDKGEIWMNYALAARLYRDLPSSAWKTLPYLISREAAKQYLLPIDASLLEPPVARIYQEAFETAWKDASEQDGYRLDLAKATVLIRKVTLLDMEAPK
jgi:hypothetical protein